MALAYLWQICVRDLLNFDFIDWMLDKRQSELSAALTVSDSGTYGIKFVTPLECVTHSPDLRKSKIWCTCCDILFNYYPLLHPKTHCLSVIVVSPSFLQWLLISILKQQRGVGWVSWLAFPFFFSFFLGCNCSQNLSHFCYCPIWIEIVSKSHFMFSSTVLSLHCFGNGALTHMDTCMFCYSHISLICSLMYLNLFSIFFLLFCSNLVPYSNLSLLFYLFHISPLFFTPVSSPAPFIILYTGGESAVPTEQHWCGG